MLIGVLLRKITYVGKNFFFKSQCRCPLSAVILAPKAQFSKPLPQSEQQYKVLSNCLGVPLKNYGVLK